MLHEGLFIFELLSHVRKYLNYCIDHIFSFEQFFVMKRGYPFTSGNLNSGYSYDYTPKFSRGGGGTGAQGPIGPPPLKIEQDHYTGDRLTKIAFTTPQTRQDQYGMLFAVRFLNDTVKAEDSMSVFTDAGGVDTLEQIKGLNSVGLVVNGNRYWYFLAKIRADRIARTETTVQFNFTSTKLKHGKMVLEIYEGYIFDNFSDSDYTSANLTTHTPYPHQKDFDKHKFRDAMTGDVLLAGTEQNRTMERSPQTTS